MTGRKLNKSIIVLFTLLIVASLLQNVASDVLTKFEYSPNGRNMFEFRDGTNINGTIQIWPGTFFESMRDSDFDGIPDTNDTLCILDFDNDFGEDNLDPDDDNDGQLDYPVGDDKVLTSPWTGTSIYIGDDRPAPARYQFRMNSTDNWTGFTNDYYDLWYLNLNTTWFENGEYNVQIRRLNDLNYTGGEWTYEPVVYSYRITIDNPTSGIPLAFVIIPVMTIIILGTALFFRRRLKE